MQFIKDANDCYTVYTGNGKPLQFGPSHDCYKILVQCVKDNDVEKIERVINVGHAIDDWSEGNINMSQGRLMYGDEEVDESIYKYAIAMIQQGFDKMPIVNFLENLYQNQSFRAVTELHNFMQHKYLPMTDDGCLIAHKGVVMYTGDEPIQGKNGEIKKGDLVDKYTGKTFRNNLGDTAEMPRHQVDDNCGECCAKGLHAGSFDYATRWAGSEGLTVTVKINPKDVVSIPTKESEKMRCCRYEVIGVSDDVEKFREAVFKVEEPEIDKEAAKILDYIASKLKDS